MKKFAFIGVGCLAIALAAASPALARGGGRGGGGGFHGVGGGAHFAGGGFRGGERVSPAADFAAVEQALVVDTVAVVTDLASQRASLSARYSALAMDIMAAATPPATTTTPMPT